MSREKEKKIFRLFLEQRKSIYPYQPPQIIKPRRIKPYCEIEDWEERAVVILWKCGFSQRRLALMFGKSRHWVGVIVEKWRK